MALSTCPGGDLSVDLWGPGAGDPLSVCRPLSVEVQRPEAGLLDGWTPPRSARYAGLHGIRRPQWGEDDR